AGKAFRCPGHRRATGRTKFRLDPPSTFIRTIFIGLEAPLEDFHVALSKIRNYPKRAPRPVLARRAVANPGYVRLPHDSIPHRSAMTTSLMCVSHNDVSLLSAPGRSGASQLLSPLRTQRATFTALRSSMTNAP